VAFVNTTIRPKADIVAGKTPTIYNKVVALKDVEESVALSANTKRFTIRVRGTSQLKLAFTSGESGTKFVTIPMHATYFEDNVDFTGTLYFQTNRDAQIVEIVEWTV
jgi:hypothetical protein